MDGDEVAGSASFLGTKRGVLGGRLGDDRISFNTQTPRDPGRRRKRNGAPFPAGGSSGDGIRFIMQTEGGFSDHPPVKFTAKH